jgi:hypothetical protein
MGSRQVGRPTVRLTPRRASGGSPKFHGRVRVRQSVSFRDSMGGPARVWSVDQADLSAGGGGETLCRIPVQHRDLVDHGRTPGVLQHVRARALDRPGFCQPRAAAWQWQITRTGVIPSTMACVFASISCAGSNTIWWSRAGTSHESAHARDHDSSRLRDLDDAGRRNVWPVTSLCMHRHQEAPLTKSCAQVQAEVRPPERRLDLHSGMRFGNTARNTAN